METPTINKAANHHLIESQHRVGRGMRRGRALGMKFTQPNQERVVDGREGLLIRRLDGYPTLWGDPWFQVNDDVILPFSLDGRWHMCKLPRDPEPRCIIRPPDT